MGRLLPLSARRLGLFKDFWIALLGYFTAKTFLAKASNRGSPRKGSRKGSNPDESKTVAVTVVVGFFEKLYRLIVLTEPDMDQRKEIGCHIAVL